jgi:hypothetical protein
LEKFNRFKQNPRFLEGRHAIPSVNVCVFTIPGSEVTDQQIRKQITLASQIWQIKFIISNITLAEEFAVPTGDASSRNNPSQEVQQLFNKRSCACPNVNNVGVFYSNADSLSNNATARAFPALAKGSNFYDIILTKSALENTLAHELGHILFYSNPQLRGKNPDPNSNGTHSTDSRNIMHGTVNINKRKITPLQRLKALGSTLIEYR